MIRLIESWIALVVSLYIFVLLAWGSWAVFMGIINYLAALQEEKENEVE